MSATTWSGPPQRRRSYLLGALLLAVLILAGFTRSYYLRPWLGGRQLTPLAHLHGVLMSAWVALFLTQVTFIERRRVRLHRLLGSLGALFAAVLVAVGIYTIGAAAERQQPGASVGQLALTFVAFDGLSLLLFGTLVGWAVVQRRRPAVHRRLMLMALVSLLPPAYGRLVALVMHQRIDVVVLALMVVTVGACVAFDARRPPRWHAALLWPAAAIVAVNLLTWLAQTYG